jgi:hypothetical protein
MGHIILELVDRLLNELATVSGKGPLLTNKGSVWDY